MKNLGKGHYSNEHKSIIHVALINWRDRYCICSCCKYSFEKRSIYFLFSIFLLVIKSFFVKIAKDREGWELGIQRIYLKTAFSFDTKLCLGWEDRSSGSFDHAISGEKLQTGKWMTGNTGSRSFFPASLNLLTDRDFSCKSIVEWIAAMWDSRWYIFTLFRDHFFTCKKKSFSFSG